MRCRKAKVMKESDGEEREKLKQNKGQELAYGMARWSLIGKRGRGNARNVPKALSFRGENSWKG